MLVASISGTVDDAFRTFFAWIPHLVGALVVLIIGFFVAKLLGRLVHSALKRAGLDRTVHGGTGGGFIQRVVPSPSSLIGRIVYWAVMLGAISLAVTVLGITALTAFVASIYAYLPNVLAALLIFLVAGAVSAAVAALAQRVMGGTALGKIVATAAPIIVMAIAVFMILEQLKIATAIVTITYAAIMGAIALGSALAFGLGGRQVAQEMLQGAYEKGQEKKDELKDDLDQGIQRGKEDLDQVREQAAPSDGATAPRASAGS